MNAPSRRAVLRAGAAVGLASIAGCTAPGVETRSEETRTLPVDGADSLAVENVNGSVTVRAWDDADVELRVVKRGFFTDDLSGVTVDVTRGDGELLVTTSSPVPSPRIVVEVHLRVPPTFPVSRLETSNGSVDARGTTGDLTVRTHNGSVDVRRVDGFVALTTSNGSVSAVDVGGVDGVRTTNGSVEVDVPAIRGDTTLESSNGSIRAAISGDVDADLSAQTSNGGVDASGLSLSDVTASRTRLTGTLGDGGPSLRVVTTNGDVELSLL